MGIKEGLPWPWTIGCIAFCIIKFQGQSLTAPFLTVGVTYLLCAFAYSAYTVKLTL